jgi:hypothetical protein
VGLELVRRRPLDPGDFYGLLAPRDDERRVRTTSEETCVSIHLLASDTGCVWRHTYDERTGEARRFRVYGAYRSDGHGRRNRRRRRRLSC